MHLHRVLLFIAASATLTSDERWTERPVRAVQETLLLQEPRLCRYL
jgi:hypothetical protein